MDFENTICPVEASLVDIELADDPSGILQGTGNIDLCRFLAPSIESDESPRGIRRNPLFVDAGKLERDNLTAGDVVTEK